MLISPRRRNEREPTALSVLTESVPPRKDRQKGQTSDSATMILLTTFYNALVLLTILVPQVYAVYQLTKEEIQAFIDLKEATDFDYTPNVPVSAAGLSNSSFDMKPRRRTRPQQPRWPRSHHPINSYPRQETSLADCSFHNGWNRDGLRFRYRLVESVCRIPGVSAFYKVNCATTFTVPPTHNHRYRQPNMLFRHYCPKLSVCMPYQFLRQIPEWEHLEARDVHCIDPTLVVVIDHEAVASSGVGTSGTKDAEFCSPDVSIPGINYPSTGQETSFMLTQEVSWANGSYYSAPKLYIQDSPKFVHNGFDRAFKTNTDVVSASITVGSVRGRLQSKPVRFCMEMIRGGNVWTVMMYTWFHINARRSMPPSMNLANVNET